MLDFIIIVLSILFIFFIWIILYDSNRFVIKEITFQDKRIKKHYRAVILADLHNKEYGKDNKSLLEAVKEQAPDGVWIAGDIITAQKGEKFARAATLLEQLAQDYPIYYANGNHEHRLKLYPEIYGSMADQYEKALKEMGISRLVNEHIALEPYNIVIYGSEIDKYYYKRFKRPRMEAAYLNTLLGSPPEDCYNVLIAHDPDYFPEYADWGADLTVSGHVHGGIVRIPYSKGFISPALKIFPKYDGGIFEEKGKTMILSRGLGMHTIPLRLFNPGELIVVNLKPEE